MTRAPIRAQSVSSLRSRGAPSATIALELAEQRSVNLSSLGQRAAFATHRAQVTELICAAAGSNGKARLCVLGAGNCNDLDLSRVAQHYAEIHLVDIDGDAVASTISRADKSVRRHLRAHAPLDVSGVLERLPRWKAMQVTPEELFACPAECASAIATALPGPFDVVLSACLLTQLQLSVLRGLTEEHPLFEAARQLTNLVHLRSMMRLLEEGGRGLLVTDASSDQICDLEPFEHFEGAAERAAALLAHGQAGKLFYAVEPGLLALACRTDPELQRGVRLEPIRDAWLWRNGPQRTFLSYALEFERLGRGNG